MTQSNNFTKASTVVCIMGHIKFLVILLLTSFFCMFKCQPRPPCQSGYFKLPGMAACHEWLKCTDLRNIDVGPVIGVGSTKVVYLSSWNGFHMAVSYLNNPDYLSDFMNGLDMLKKLNPSQYIVQLIGFCEEQRIILTEYHRLGNATNLPQVMERRYGWDSIVPRIQLCLNYAHILDYLHEGPAGIRVMCDSNDLNKLLSQLLIKEDLSLVLNDVDALPLVDRSSSGKIKCGDRELVGDFVAPEQKWPFKGPFRAAAMPGYDEKSDIWKAADVCAHIVKDVYAGAEWIQYRLFNLHKSCKNPDPNLRPTAKYLISVYKKIIAEVSSIKTEL